MSSVENQQSNLRLEYELIHKIRMNWSDAMMRWRQISIPLCATIVSFFVLLNVKLWLLGWFVGLCILLYWRFIEKHIDTQIVGFYPRILELEKELGMNFYSHYIFNNLNRRFPKAKSILEYLPDGTFNHSGLLELAREHGSEFVGRRGHSVHFWLVVGYSITGVLAAIVYYPLLLN